MSEGERLSCFKAYDIRGVFGKDLTLEVAYRVGRAYATSIQPPGPVAVGRDVRRSSPALAEALSRGLVEGGIAVHDLGLCGTEMVYLAASRDGMGGGIMITASHNPPRFNGLKMVRRNAHDGAVRPVTDEEGLAEIERRVRTDDLGLRRRRARITAVDLSQPYLERVLSFVAGVELRPLRVVVNPGNGCAGPAVDLLAEHLPFRLFRIQRKPNSGFPRGVPNPLLPAKRAATAACVRTHKADLGVAWDGDFDRCFLFDEHGEFIEGYYIVGLLAEQLLRQHGPATVIHDPRLFWNTLETVAEAGGTAVMSKTGHARIKALMVETGALYGGEMSAHHYFRDFAGCDTGMVPWLLVAALMSRSGRPLSELVAERVASFPCSGEINREVVDPDRAFALVEQHFAGDATAVDPDFDGLSMEFGQRWRFNLRQSDTQPELIRLNVESRGDRPLMEAKTAEVLGLLEPLVRPHKGRPSRKRSASSTAAKRKA